jgi:hypothetical protein
VNAGEREIVGKKEDRCYEIRRAEAYCRTVSSVLCGLVCPSRTSERGGKGECVKEGGGEEGEQEGERKRIISRISAPDFFFK